MKAKKVPPELNHVLWLIALLLIFAQQLGRAYDLPGVPSEHLAWYQNVETNPGSTPRTDRGWSSAATTPG
jgi:hypothetical protein